MADTLAIVCPNCSNQMRASAKHVGRRGKCPQCGHLVVIVPAGGEDRSAVSLAAGPDDDDRADGPAGYHPLLAAGIGLTATVLLYVVFYALPKGSYLYLFMTDRSYIQHMIVLVTCWGLAILALKYVAVRRELRSAELELELIPLEIGMQITPANVDKFLAHLDQLPPGERDGQMARRVRGALEHFKHRTNVSEVQSYLATQADIEASAVDSGYTLMRVFIWVCPILGFIGTVYGISLAVTDLANSLQQMTAAAPAPPAAPGTPGPGDKLMDGLKNVTGGLATAFDTTFLGLIGVVLLMFPTEALKKVEYEMLDRVQGFANEFLLRRMAEGADDSQLPEVVRRALDGAFKEHQRWLTQWQAQVGKLGELIGADFEGHFANCQERLAKAEAGRVDAFAALLRRAEELVGVATASWQRLGSAEFAGALTTLTRLHDALASNTGALNRVLESRAAAPAPPAVPPVAPAEPSLVLEPVWSAEVPVTPVTQMSDGRPPGAAALPPAAPRPGFFGRIFGGGR